MKVPKRPLNWRKIVENSVSEPAMLMKIMSSVNGSMVDGKYLHWDDLRHRTPPDGLTHDQWWCGLKFARMSQRKGVALRDKDGSGFSFVLADILAEALPDLDSSAKGMVGSSEAIVNSELKSFYLVRSLMEEAITSSQLEGAATTREVAKEMIRQGRPPSDQSERMILNNYRTMLRILEIKDEPLSPQLLFEIHRLITEGTLEDPSAAGRLRTDAEYKIVGDEFGEIYHEPPSATELAARVDAMCEFANAKTPVGFVHPAIRSMILHFWLAYDHPFIDGNGRTARALFYWSMLRNGYWLFEYVSVSRIILKGPHQYGRAFLLTETDENDLTYFLVYHIEVVRRSIQDLYRFLEDRTARLRALEKDLKGMESLNHRQRALVGHALRHPGHAYTNESHQNSHNVVYETSRTDLLDLVRRKLLIKKQRGKGFTFHPSPDIEARLRSEA